MVSTVYRGITLEQRQITLYPSDRRGFHSTPFARDNGVSPYHFDTFKFVRRLEAEGFTLEQSEAVMSSLREVIDER